MLSLKKSYKNRKVSLTIHCKYKYFYSTVQRAEDRRQKFHFGLLAFAVSVMLNLSIIIQIGPCARSDWSKTHVLSTEYEQAAISQKEIVFRFRKDVQSEKGWCLMSCA